MEEGNPEPQEQAVQVAEVVEVADSHENEGQADREEQMVPVSAVQKERKKRQQAVQDLEELRRRMQKPAEEDYSKYENVTKEELGQSKLEIIRDIREADWAERNPERAAQIQENLEDFLKTRPNLAPAIQGATNRLQEAWELMTALSKKNEKAKVTSSRKEVPISPGTVPKAASLNEAVDVMNMSDKDFVKWRSSKSNRRGR